MDSSQLLALIAALRGRTVAVVGDVVADEFVYGRVARVSREAPVLILEYDSTEILPGAGGNAANNVAALGGDAALASVVGRDEPATRLLRALHRRVDTRAVVRVANRVTAVKTRILAGGIHSAKQQVVRIDRGVNQVADAKTRAAFERAVMAATRWADAVLVSDYGSGLVTPALVSRLRAALKREGHPIPVLVDSRYQLLQYRGLTACTPNESEVEQALGVRINDDMRVLERAGRAILAQTKMQAVLITRGSRGMTLFVPGSPTVHIPIYGSDEIADVTGAGDTVMATLSLALAAGATFEAAARLANYAGGIVVMKRGTATVSPDELRNAVLSDVGDAGRAGLVGRASRSRLVDQASRSKPAGQASQSGPAAQASRSRPVGRASRSRPVGRASRSRPVGRASRSRPGRTATANLSRRSANVGAGAKAADLSRRSARRKKGAKADG